MEALIQQQMKDVRMLLSENNERVMQLVSRRLKTAYTSSSVHQIDSMFQDRVSTPITAAPVMVIKANDKFAEVRTFDEDVIAPVKPTKMAWFMEDDPSVNKPDTEVQVPTCEGRQAVYMPQDNRSETGSTWDFGGASRRHDFGAARTQDFENESRQDESQAAPRQVFADAAAMKAKVRAAIANKPYNVTEFYKETGLAQWLAKSALFEHITLCVIAVNSIWIAVDTDYNTAATLADADTHFQVIENLFCAYFSMEWFIRFAAFRRSCDSLHDFWFVFDSALVAMMVIETWLMPLTFVFFSPRRGGIGTGFLRLAKLMRLTRVARMARLLRSTPELLVLIKGIVVATRSVTFTLCLLFIIVYVFALGFVQIDGNIHEDAALRVFRSVPQTVAWLLLWGILPDNAEQFYSIGQHNVILVIVFSIFFLIASLTIMNMLTGVLVEVVQVVSTVEKEALVVSYVRSQLISVMEANGVVYGEDSTISQEQFKALLLNRSAARVLSDIGVDVVGLVDVSEFIFQDKAAIGVSDFMELILQLRGNNTATVRDIVELRKLIVTELTNTEKRMAMRRVPTSLQTENEVGENKRSHYAKSLHGPALDAVGRAEKLLAAVDRYGGLDTWDEHQVTGFAAPGFLV
eukprot:TRINITY_DN37262_c0_g1_i1.p1 TRINITY_DN37262_c0_g1~~TRINITY_DN37262_c0_g1_i1.p1  ORF type:complete len:632 (+),score=118.62 TRINITY_DN37262_c0_g1_i1:220-2115(+)